MTDTSTALTINRFVRKPFYVDAVQVTNENLETVAEWCGGKIEDAKPDKDIEEGRVPDRFIRVKVYRAMSDRQTMAFVNDWILYAGKGYKVYTNPAFEKSFELIDGSLDNQPAAP